MDVRTSKAFIINVIGMLLPVAVLIVTVPCYVKLLGAERYGVYALIWLFLGYAGFLDFGLARACSTFIARTRDLRQQARYIVAALYLSVGVGICGAILFALFGTSLFQKVAPLSGELTNEIEQSSAVLASLIPATLIYGLCLGVLEGRRKFMEANAFQVGGMLLGQITPLLIGNFFSASLTALVTAAVVCRLLLVLTLLCRTVVGGRLHQHLVITPQIASELLRYGSGITLSAFLNPILSSIDQLTITRILGPSALTPYSVSMSIVVRSQVLAAALSRTLFPDFASRSKAEARERAELAVSGISILYGAGCLLGVLCAGPFFEFWISTEFRVAATPIAIILFVGAWLNGLAFLPYALLQASGRPAIVAKLSLAQLVPYSALVYVLTKTFGTEGAALAWTLRSLIDFVLLARTARLSFAKLSSCAAVFAVLCVVSAISFLHEPSALVRCSLFLASSLSLIVIGFAQIREICVQLGVPALLKTWPHAPLNREVNGVERTTSVQGVNVIRPKHSNEEQPLVPKGQTIAGRD